MSAMTALTVRNLAEGTVAKLRVRAAQHGRSMEAEARFWLTAVADNKVEIVAPEMKAVDWDEINARVDRAQARVRAAFGGVMPTGVVDEYLAEKREAARRGE